jgi:AbiV family abortive infection protein
MASKKSVNMEMARACYENARKLYLDSIALRRRKSIGHAYSMLVLSIEESVKSILYKLAADGLVKFLVGKSPDPTAINEEDLLHHKPKHKMLADIIAASIVYAPFSTAFEGIREKRISVTKAKHIMTAAIAEHQVLMADLSDPRSRVSTQVTKFFVLLESLNEEKNLGFYVNKKGSSILLPNRVSRARYEYWRDFQRDFLVTTKSILESGIDPLSLKIFKESQRNVARRLRKVTEQTKAKS